MHVNVLSYNGNPYVLQCVTIHQPTLHTIKSLILDAP